MKHIYYFEDNLLHDIVYSIQARFSSLLRSRSGRSHESSCHAVLTIYDFWPGPALGEGLGGSPPLFEKKRNLCWKKNIRLADLVEVSKIYDWSVSILYHKMSTRENKVPYSLVVSLKTTIFSKLHLVVDFCVFTSQVM